MASICGSPVCAGGKPKLKFTYTGDYVVRDDGVVELHSSGTLVFIDPAVIDVFMVGGGGCGGACEATSGSSYYSANGGGGGGYTRTVKRVACQGSYQITIGDGSTAPNVDGGSSSWGTDLTVSGGKSARKTSAAPTSSASPGWAGGSGGGGGVISNSDYGTGGSDGSDGEKGFYGTSVGGGAGQGFTTREFGEATGKLYSGGGGGGRAMMSTTPIVSAGGSGGGGAGGFRWDTNVTQVAGAGGANTGGGGGGAVGSYWSGMQGGSGGSGIVCFRDAQELPELAGTWVLNERLYKSENTIIENINYTLGDTACNGFQINNDYVMTRVTGQSGYSYIYRFDQNRWVIGNRSITITSATASDEFRAWLASNATKQA
jgi:hypothetical protein